MFNITKKQFLPVLLLHLLPDNSVSLHHSLQMHPSTVSISSQAPKHLALLQLFPRPEKGVLGA